MAWIRLMVAPLTLEGGIIPLAGGELAWLEHCSLNETQRDTGRLSAEQEPHPIEIPGNRS